MGRQRVSRRRTREIRECIRSTQPRDTRKRRCPFLVGDGGSRSRGAGVAAAGIASPRPPRRAPSSSPGRAPPAGSSTAPCGRGGGTERGRVRAARASLGTNAFGRGATRERATSISSSKCRVVGRARARKKGGSRRGRIQFAPTPPVYPRHASPKWAAITGAANATDTGCVARDPRRAARHAAPRRSRDPASSTPADPSARRESTESARSTPGRAQPPPRSPTFSLPSSRALFTASTRRRMAATTAAAAAAGSAPPR